MGACDDCGSWGSCHPRCGVYSSTHPDPLFFDETDRKPRPRIEPPAKYESQGTWFSREEEQKRALRLQIAGRLKRNGQMLQSRGYAIRYCAVAPGPYDVISVALDDSFRTYPQTPPKAERTTMAKATINVPGLAPIDVSDLNLLTLSTEDGHEIGGATAGYAYDRLHELCGQFSPLQARGTGHASDMGLALRLRLEELKDSNYKHGNERQAVAFALGMLPGDRMRLGTDDLEQAAKRVVSERDEARAQVKKLEDYIANTEPRTTHYGKATHAAAPALTPETPVTLGMLQDLTLDADEVRYQNSFGRPRARSIMGQVLDAKLGKR